MPEGVGYLQIGQPEYSEQVFRSLDVKGDLPGMLDPRYGLGIQVEDWTRPEFWWLRRGRTYRSGGVAGPVAAQNSFFTLNLVAGAAAGTQLAVVDALLISNTQATAQQYQAYTAAPAVVGAVVNAQQADDRQSGPPAFEVRQGTTAALPTSLAAQVNLFIPPGTTMLVPGPWVLSGLAMLVVSAVTVNISHAVTMVWRERALLSSER